MDKKKSAKNIKLFVTLEDEQFELEQ